MSIQSSHRPRVSETFSKLISNNYPGPLFTVLTTQDNLYEFMGDFLAFELLGSIVGVAESVGGSAALAFIKKDVKNSFKINS